MLMSSIPHPAAMNEADPHPYMKAREVNSQARACCGSDYHWLLHFLTGLFWIQEWDADSVFSLLLLEDKDNGQQIKSSGQIGYVMFKHDFEMKYNMT